MSLVSTIIPVYNRPAMLRQAVECVVAQTHRPIEIVVVDDGSTDETPEVAGQLAAANPDVIRFVRQANGGPGSARNAGLRHALGEYIQYLDSDDLIRPRKFELQVAALEQRPDADVCYCVTLRPAGEGGELRPYARTAETIERIFPEFLASRGWHTVSPLWRRRLCDRIGPWGDFRVMEDWEHDIRAGMLGAGITHVPEPLVVVRDHEGPRASGRGVGFTPFHTREFFRAHRSVWKLMRERGLTDWSYLAGFSRTMFWIARMCGERGLLEEAREALAMAEEMAVGGRTAEMRAFRLMTRVLGWRIAVLFSERSRAMFRALAVRS